MAKNERFEKTYSQGTMNVTEIWEGNRSKLSLSCSRIFRRIDTAFRQRWQTGYFSDCKWIMEVKSDDEGRMVQTAL